LKVHNLTDSWEDYSTFNLRLFNSWEVTWTIEFSVTRT